jgi:hypothetical protein
MAKLRPPGTRVPEGITSMPRRNPKDYEFQKGHPRLENAGRARGTPNIIPRSTREAIFQGLAIAGNTMGKEGIVSYVVEAALADFKYGIALLSMVTPRHLNADVTIRNEPVITTIGQLDAELAKAGLPPSGEIFKIDFKGSPAPSDVDEAEVVEAETSPPATVAK